MSIDDLTSMDLTPLFVIFGISAAIFLIFYYCSHNRTKTVYENIEEKTEYRLKVVSKDLGDVINIPRPEHKQKYRHANYKRNKLGIRLPYTLLLLFFFCVGHLVIFGTGILRKLLLAFLLLLLTESSSFTWLQGKYLRLTLLKVPLYPLFRSGGRAYFCRPPRLSRGRSREDEAWNGP